MQTTDPRPLVIYHANCTDGFTGAWCFYHFYGSACDFHAASYGSPPPAVVGRHVYLVDFSYPRETLIDLVSLATSVTLIDHHKTAFDEVGAGIPGLQVYMDDKRSGAMLAWDYLWRGQEPAPELIWYVQDRDLWEHKMPLSAEVNAYIQSFNMDFESWNELMSIPATGIGDISRFGSAILRTRRKNVAEIARQHRVGDIFGFSDIPVCNCAGMFASDVGHELGKDKPFSLTYYDGQEKVYFSLRSRPDGEDVEVLAKRMGGGGHKHAAGFTIRYDDHNAWASFADVFSI